VLFAAQSSPGLLFPNDATVSRSRPFYARLRTSLAGETPMTFAGINRKLVCKMGGMKSA
jgi:hypothetical protein